MNSDEIAAAGVEIVKQALLDCLPERGIRSLVVSHFNNEQQIRFAALVGSEEITFGVHVEPFLPPGSATRA